MIDLTLGNATLAVADDSEEYGIEYEYDAAGPALEAAAMTAQLQNVSGCAFVMVLKWSNILALIHRKLQAQAGFGGRVGCK